MSRLSQWAVAAAVVGPLLSLYFAVLYWLALNPVFLPASPVEEVVLGTMLLRLLLIFSVRRLRSNTLAAIDLFTAEVLVLPALILLGLAGGNSQMYLPLIRDILLAWPSALLLVFPAFAVYKVSAMLRRGATLTSLIVSSTSVFVWLILILSATSQTTTEDGLGGMTRLVLAAILNGSTSAATRPIVTVAGVALYVGLVAHSAIGDARASRTLEPLLVFPVLGTAAALAWGFLAGLETSDTVLIYAVPSLVLIAIVWLGCRAD
jgi:hypothetical protein